MVTSQYELRGRRGLAEFGPPVRRICRERGGTGAHEKKTLREGKMALQMAILKAHITRLYRQQDMQDARLREFSRYQVKHNGESLRLIVELTERMFPGPVRVETSHDPEFPDDVSTVFHVEAEGEVSEIVQQELKWHELVSTIFPNSTESIRLFVHDK